jgi:oligosaccharide repeat unit polymerase
MLLVAGINRYNLVVELFSLSSLPNLFYVDRDSGIFQLPWQINGFIYFTYTASLIGGFTFNLFLDKKKLFCFIPLFIAFFYGVVLAVRSGIFLSIILWLSGWLGSLVYLQDFKFRPQTIMFSLVSFMVLIIVFISVGWLRSGANDYFLLMEFIDYARISYFGHLSAFSTWLNDYHYTGLTFGANTFSGPLDLLGINEREVGFYKQNIFLTDGIYTNIFTVFRGLIEDFSIPGTLIIGFGVGMCVRLAFNRCSYGHFMWMVPLTLFYAFVLYSPIISLFNYNSAIMAWIFTYIPLILIRKKLVI